MGAYLLLVVDEYLELKGLTRRALSTAHRPRSSGALSEAALSRLWNGEAAAPRAGWDHFIITCGEVLEVKPVELWDAALRAWKQDPTGEIPKSLRRL